MKTKNQQFLENFNKAFSQNDLDFILHHVTDDVCWTSVGDFSVQGKKAFQTVLENMAANEPYELKINHIITHGHSAAVDGRMISKDGKKYAFCDVYQFNGLKNPRIKEMISYVIEIR